MAHKRKTQPDKPAPFVPKTTAEIITSRPYRQTKPIRSKSHSEISERNGQTRPFRGDDGSYFGNFTKHVLVVEDAAFGLFEGIGVWSRGLQRSVGGYCGPARPWLLLRDRESVPNWGRMTVTETMPPDPNLLKFLLERRIPERYREIKEVQHTHNAGALFQEFLKRMDEPKAKAQHRGCYRGRC